MDLGLAPGRLGVGAMAGWGRRQAFEAKSAGKSSRGLSEALPCRLKIAPQAFETMESAAENPSRSPAVTESAKVQKVHKMAPNALKSLSRLQDCTVEGGLAILRPCERREAIYR